MARRLPIRFTQLLSPRIRIAQLDTTDTQRRNVCRRIGGHTGVGTPDTTLQRFVRAVIPAQAFQKLALGPISKLMKPQLFAVHRRLNHK
jgi:hypothetical protein